MLKRFRSKYTVILILLPLFYILLYFIYKPRIYAFGCFDDCAHFMTAYFMIKGKQIYSQIFTNHQPLIAFISYAVQTYLHPKNIYELILAHRLVLLGFSFIFNLGLILRFGFPAAGFVLIYELSKFYVFGDRFLAEGFIVYPFVYLAGLSWYKLLGKKIFNLEYYLAVVFVWFITFMRLPYIPAALFIFLFIITKTRRKIQIASLALFGALTIFLFLFLPFREYIFNIITVNYQTILSSEVKQQDLLKTGILKVFLYPIYLFFDGDWNIFRHLEIGLSIIFISLSAIFLYKKKWKFVLFSWIVLGLVNLRFTPPGKIFYESFHMTNWYALFILFIFLKMQSVVKFNKKLGLVFAGGTTSVFLYFLASPQNFIYDKIDPHSELITNYGPVMQVGTVVNQLSNPDDTLFLDGFHDLIYWQANRLSPYQYSWYTSIMPQFAKYKKARQEMFRTNPPDFYYGPCPGKDFNLLPNYIKNKYRRMYSEGNLTCLYIYENKVKEITEKQWQAAKQSLYELPIH